MKEPISLRAVERKAFQTTFADGLWDVLLGCFALQWAVAPFLSKYLGDFWSSAIFLPFWGLVYFAIRLARKYVVAPRVGTFHFGKVRQQKLRHFSLVMLVVNTLALILAIIAVINPDLLFSSSGINNPGILYSSLMGMFLLIGFSTAAFVLDFPRLFVYGLMLFIGPPLGEWLYANYGAAHHGIPIVFGFSAGIMILTGLALFIRLLKNNPLVEDQVA